MRSTGGTATLRGVALTATCAAALLCLVRPASAAYPDRPVTILVPFAPAGPTDIIARVLANVLSQRLGQKVVVDNRAGAAGNTGMGQVARATPDGYTLLVTSTAIAVNSALFKKLPYDPIKDFAPISELVNAPNVLVVRARLRHQDHRRPGRARQGRAGQVQLFEPGAGTKSHLTGELLKLRADIEMVHVPVSRRRSGGAGGGGRAPSSRVGRARGGRAADPGRAVARARGHQREALVLAARTSRP